MADRFADKIAAAKARQAAAKDQARQAGNDYRDRAQQIDAERNQQLADLDAQHGTAKQQHPDQQPAPPAKKPKPTGPVTFGKFILEADKGRIQKGLFDSRPLPGVTAALGDLQSSPGGRLARGAGVLAGSLTATANALGRIGAKQLTITGPGWQWTTEVPAHRIAAAQAFADAVNAAAQQQ